MCTPERVCNSEVFKSIQNMQVLMNVASRVIDVSALTHQQWVNLVADMKSVLASDPDPVPEEGQKIFGFACDYIMALVNSVAESPEHQVLEETMRIVNEAAADGAD